MNRFTRSSRVGEVFNHMSEEDKKVDGDTPAEKTPDTETPETPNTPDSQPETPVSEATMEETREAAAAESAIAETETGDVETVEMPHRDLKPGMFVRVHERIVDVNSKGEKRQRVQIFEGLLIGMRGAGISRTMTVRKNAKGWMVEKIFPLSSPNVEKVEVVKQYRTRRAKLSFLRGRFKRKLREMKTK